MDQCSPPVSPITVASEQSFSIIEPLPRSGGNSINIDDSLQDPDYATGLRDLGSFRSDVLTQSKSPTTEAALPTGQICDRSILGVTRKTPLQERSTSLSRSDPSEQNPPSWLSRLQDDTWYCEIAGLGLSILALSSLCGLLLAYDDKPVLSLPKHITVSSAPRNKGSQ